MGLRYYLIGTWGMEKANRDLYGEANNVKVHVALLDISTSQEQKKQQQRMEPSRPP